MAEHSGANPACAVGEARYHASGKVEWGRFLPLAALTLLAAAVLAWLLDVVFVAGYQVVILAPLIALLPLAGLGYWAIGGGHCRSRLVAAAFGLAVGFVLYIGSYYAGLYRALPPGSGLRLDLLPQYLAERMHEDVQVRTPGNRSDVTKRPDPFLNYSSFLMELGMVLVLSVWGPFQWSRRAYCETCGHWKTLELAFFRQGTGRALLGKITPASLAALAAEPRQAKGRPEGQKYTAVAVERCTRTEGTASPCPVYLSVKEVSLGSNFGDYQRYDGALGKMLVRQHELRAEEMASLSPVFPSLRP